MTTSHAKPRAKNQSISSRKFESEALVLQSLRLIAAPRPEDDLSDEELADICRNGTRSSELVRHLIEYIKTI